MCIRILILTLLPIAANANVGIPVVAFGFPFMLANLVLIVALESVVLKKLKTNLALGQILKHVLIANLITTLIGYPIVAILEALSALIGMHIGWLLPYSNLSQMKLYISVAMTMTLVPCYFLSVWIEGLWLRKKLSPDITWKKIFILHLASYAFLLLQIFSHLPVPLLQYSILYEPFFEILAAIARWFGY